MLIDAREIETGTVVRADVCIIGAGAAGISMAKRLSDHGRDVLLLESGGFEAHQPTQALNQGDLEGEPMRFFASEPDLEFMRLRRFGGTTNHWGGWCHPLTEPDFQERPHIPGSGWPFDRAHLDRWYADAQELCQLGPFEYDASWWSEQGAGEPILDLPSFATTLYQLSPPTRFGEVYRDELVSSDAVTVYLWANAVNLDVVEERIAAVDVATLSGREFRVEPDTVVLATGAIESSRLLLASNRQRPDGIGNQHDLVGRYFAEHPHLDLGLILFPEAEDLDLYYLRDREVARQGDDAKPLTTIAGLVIGQEAAERASLPGMSAIVHGLLKEPAGTAGVVRADVATLLDAVRGTAPDQLVGVTVMFEQRPNPESRVTLLDERDAVGMPRPKLDWRLTDDDRAGMVRGTELLAQELAAAGKGRLQLEVDGQAVVDRPVDVGFHHTGTARMHPSPRRGVVDADGRVHGTNNLYVAGGAVFPTGGWAHPTLTIVAVALRLADHLGESRR